MSTTFATLDVAIGLIFVYLLLSLICSTLQEFIANITSWRGKHLRASIKAMLNDPTKTGLARRLYRHPRIATLSLPGKLPSYIPSATFAKALVDLILEDNNFHPAAVVSGPLAPFVRDADGKVENLEAQFAKWFDDSMDRLGGWYKRNVQLVLFAIGLILTVALNINSLEVARTLWTQPLLRDALVQAAGKFDASKATDPKADQIAIIQKQLDALHLPIGWREETLTPLFDRNAPARNRWLAWGALIAGWLMTAFATSFGSQFWFQTLGQALALRAAGAKPPKSSDTAAARTGD